MNAMIFVSKGTSAIITTLETIATIVRLFKPI